MYNIVLFPTEQYLINNNNFHLDSTDQCIPMWDVDHAIRNGEDRSVGSIVSYSCETGYLFPDGTSQLTVQCVSTGEWSQLPVKCQGNYF